MLLCMPTELPSSMHCHTQAHAAAEAGGQAWGAMHTRHAHAACIQHHLRGASLLRVRATRQSRGKSDAGVRCGALPRLNMATSHSNARARAPCMHAEGRGALNLVAPCACRTLSLAGALRLQEPQARSTLKRQQRSVGSLHSCGHRISVVPQSPGGQSGTWPGIGVPGGAARSSTKTELINAEAVARARCVPAPL
jgi:hypothetical protein